MRRLLRIVVSTLIVLAAYGAYAVTAVPLIDPPARVSLGPAPLSLPVPATDASSADDGMLAWFGPDPRAWELNKPKMLRNDQGILLFQNYYSDPEKLGPGKVSLEPVSMVFLSDDQTLDPIVRQRQAIVLRAPAGAVLDFDKQFNIRRADVGKLRSGTLRGKITIRSEGKLPGPEDDLWVTTHDVRLSPTRIWTADNVQFEYGLNRGQGEELEIKLLSPDERGSSQLGQIKSLTLKKNVVLNLVVKDGAPGHAGAAGFGPLPLASQPQPPREFSPDQPIVVQQGSPVTVRCEGPFHFDGEENVATFEQRVEVVRQFPSGEPDTLTCQNLALHFQPHDEPPQPKQNPQPKQHATAAADKTPKLDVRRVVARGSPGNPAVLNAPGSGAFAQGQRLEYDLQSRGVSLVDEKEVLFRQQANEIHAKELHYQPGVDGRLGRFQAAGAGWLKWATGGLRATADRGAHPPGKEKPQRHFQASWRRQLHSYPHEGRQVISLEGEAKAQVTGMGRLDAEEIHAWLFEVPQSPPPSAVSGSSRKQKYDLVPDRMLAQTKVVVDSPQLTGRTQKLEIFVHHPSTAADGRDQGSGVGDQGSGVRDQGTNSGAGTLTPQPSALQQRITGGTSAQQFDVTGQRVQVQLVQVGREAELSQLDIFGSARLLETKTAKPDERPFLVEGDYVQAKQERPHAAVVTVNGTKTIPAHVEGRGLSLTGGAINLDQGANKLWIDGPGVMTLIKVDGDLNGKKTGPPQPLHINWQGRMDFDGQRAVFDHAVVAKREQENLQTQTLEVVFNRRIDMANPKQTDGQNPDIDQIICRGGLFVERRESDERGPSSHERMQAVDLTVVRSSGAVFANGPGWITRWYRGSPNTEVNLPGAPSGPAATAKSAKAKGPAARPSTPPGAASEETLNYLRVDFQQALRGNINERVMVFRDQVQTVHVPVKNWGDTVNPDRPEQLGERGVVVKCDELQLTELQGQGPTQTSVKYFEVMALSNTMAEGQTFTAKATRMSYSQDKELLVLEGTGRTPAELWRQQTVGAPPSHLAAHRIEYYRQTNRIKIDKAQYLDATDLPGEKPGGRPKAPPGVKAR